MQAPSQVPGPTQLMGTAKADDQTVVGASAPTTLQSAASEMRLAMPTQMGEAHGGGRGLGAVLGVGAGLVVAAVVLGVVLLRDPRAGGTTTDPSHDPGHDVVDPQKGHKDDPPPQKKMHLHVTSEPPGAVVKRDDGSALGPTPLDVDLAADGSMLKLVLHKEGFKDEVRALILSDRDRSLAFRLTSNAPKEEPKEEKPKKPRTPKKPPPELHLGDDILPPKL
jgi:hypothetical protein